MSLEFEARSLTKNAENAPALAIGLPCRKTSPVDFWMHMQQMLPPLNVKMGFIIEKAAEKNVKDGKLPAAARNSILQRALSLNVDFVFFVDDDVLMPDIVLYRMWNNMQKHPEIACITAVGTTKLTPCEPLIYAKDQQGAFWDWPLGALVEIESAWAGCMMVNLKYVRQVEGPWFNDVITPPSETDERKKRNIWGQDRYFHRYIESETGGKIVADTGLLVGHWETDTQKCYIIPPDAPCFNKPIEGESFITYLDDTGYVNWRRIMVKDRPDLTFNNYLDWLKTQSTPEEIKAIIPVTEEREGYTSVDKRAPRQDFEEWFKSVGVPEE